MKNETVLLITSIAIIMGIGFLFLGAVTYKNQRGHYSPQENMDIRNQAYMETAIGFIFIAIDVVVFLIYGDIEATRKLLKRTYEQKPSARAHAF